MKKYAVPEDEHGIYKLTIKELKPELCQCGIRVSGLKAELRTRLLSTLEMEAESNQ